MTARMSVRRLPPPGLGGGINGATYAHSSSVRSLGYLRCTRLYFGRFSSVHIGDPTANQATSLESQLIQSIQEVSKRTLSRWHLQFCGHQRQEPLRWSLLAFRVAGHPIFPLS